MQFMFILLYSNVVHQRRKSMSTSVKSRTEELLQPILEKRGLSLYEIEYVKEGPDWFLRIFIDKPGGIDIEECGDVSLELSDDLDEENFIQGAYILEVSSPGVERPLRSLEEVKEQINHHIHVSLYVHIDGEKEYEGKLLHVEDDVLTIEYQVLSRKKEIEIPYDKIAKARLAVAF